jgi:hypothetical protein
MLASAPTPAALSGVRFPICAMYDHCPTLPVRERRAKSGAPVLSVVLVEDAQDSFQLLDVFCAIQLHGF